MYTEDEARKHWCPFARVGNPGVAGNRYPFDTDYSEKKAFACCIASECMAWRYGKSHWLCTGITRGPQHILNTDAPDRTGQTVKSEGEKFIGYNWDEIKRGHCGLAGEPK